MQNVYVMYIEISYKFHRIPDTQSRVLTKVYDFLGQPSYTKVFCRMNVFQGLVVKGIMKEYVFVMLMPSHSLMERHLATLNLSTPSARWYSGTPI